MKESNCNLQDLLFLGRPELANLHFYYYFTLSIEVFTYYLMLFISFFLCFYSVRFHWTNTISQKPKFQIFNNKWVLLLFLKFIANFHDFCFCMVSVLTLSYLIIVRRSYSPFDVKYDLLTRLICFGSNVTSQNSTLSDFRRFKFSSSSNILSDKVFTLM